MSYLVIDNRFGCFLDVLTVVLYAHDIIGSREVVYQIAALTTDVETVLGDTDFAWTVPATSINIQY